MKTTKVFDKLINAFVDPSIRGIGSKGGTRSSKTWSALQLLYLVAYQSEDPLLISCVTTDLPAVRRGMYRDFKRMLVEENMWDDNCLNKTELIYTFPTGSQIEFFGCDNASKVHGPYRDILFVNEAQKVPREVFRQLDVRTTLKTLIDYNPVRKFWGETEFVGNEYVTIKSTYKDNPYLTEAQVKAIEKNRNDPNWWRVYGEGETGGIEGLVYPEYKVVEYFPTDIPGFKWCCGLDFGFSHDPSAIVRVGFSKWDLYIDEIEYRPGMVNAQIAQCLHDNSLNKIYTVADRQEEKSIKELNLMKCRVIPCVKGQGSIKAGINQVKQFKIYVTKRSTNVMNELEKYSFVQDKMTGLYTNVPIDEDNHACDTFRYAVDFLLRMYRPSSIKNDNDEKTF